MPRRSEANQRQERVPVADEPRAAHAAERGPRASASCSRWRELDSRAAARASSRSSRAASTCSTLINEVLDISRIEAGQAAALARAGRSAARRRRGARSRPAAGRRAPRSRSRPSCRTATSTSLADRQRLSQVLLNLLSNAIKYNRAGGAVTRRDVARPTTASRIRSPIPAPASPPTSLDRLFIPFERLGADAQQIEGTGLGLTLSQAPGRGDGRHDRRRERSPGRARTFWVQLVATRRASSRAIDGDDERRRARRRSTGERRTRSSTSRTTCPTSSSCERILARRARHPPDRRDAGPARPRARARAPPGPDPARPPPSGHPGRRGPRPAQADPRLASIPVVILSADATRADRAAARQGADAYLAKPIDVQQFLEVVHRHTQGSRPEPPPGRASHWPEASGVLRASSGPRPHLPGGRATRGGSARPSLPADRPPWAGRPPQGERKADPPDRDFPLPGVPSCARIVTRVANSPRSRRPRCRSHPRFSRPRAAVRR